MLLLNVFYLVGCFAILKALVRGCYVGAKLGLEAWSCVLGACRSLLLIGLLSSYWRQLPGMLS